MKAIFAICAVALSWATAYAAPKNEVRDLCNNHPVVKEVKSYDPRMEMGIKGVMCGWSLSMQLQGIDMLWKYHREVHPTQWRKITHMLNEYIYTEVLQKDPRPSSVAEYVYKALDYRFFDHRTKEMIESWLVGVDTSLYSKAEIAYRDILVDLLQHRIQLVKASETDGAVNGYYVRVGFVRDAANAVRSAKEAIVAGYKYLGAIIAAVKEEVRRKKDDTLVGDGNPSAPREPAEPSSSEPAQPENPAEPSQPGQSLDDLMGGKK